MGKRINTTDDKLRWVQTRFHLDDKKLRHVIVANPAVLSKNTESTLEPRIQNLEERLGLDERDWHKFIHQADKREEVLEKKIAWLQTSLNITDKDACGMIRSLPPFLSYSIENKLAPTIECF
jgi:mTERF